jgi:hypothetical protein
LAEHYNPQIRQAGLQQLVNTSAKFDALHNEITTRSQALLDTVSKQEENQRLHFQSEFEKTQTKVREQIADADQAQRALHDDPKIANIETKFALMKMVGMTPREAKLDAGTFSIGLLGTGVSKDFDNFNPTYDEAVKMIETQRATQIKANTDYMQQIVQLAAHAGYTFAADSDGKVTVHNIGSVVEQFKQAQPLEAGPPQSSVGTIAPPITNPSIAASPLGGTINNILTSKGMESAVPPPSGLTPDMVKNLPDIGKMSSDAIESFKQMIINNRKRNWKRPTNK